MSLPVTSHLASDVIGGHEPRRRTRWRPPLRLVGCGVAGALVGAMAMVAVQAATGAAVVDASGSMVLSEQSQRLAGIPHSTQAEGRDAVWVGSIRVDLPDRQMTGQAKMLFSWAGTDEDGVIMISHNWGQVNVTFNSTTCSGPFAWSAYREPRETGGAMNLRCDDGSLFAATALLEKDEDATGDHPFRIFMTLEDGSYVAG